VTLVADLKAILEALGSLTDVYRQDWTPDDAVAPYATILDPISEAQALSGDSRTQGWRRLAQVDIWQARDAEDDSLVDAVVDAIDGAEATSGLRLRVQSTVKVPSEVEEDTWVHHAVTVSMARLR